MMWPTFQAPRLPSVSQTLTGILLPGIELLRTDIWEQPHLGTAWGISLSTPPSSWAYRQKKKKNTHCQPSWFSSWVGMICFHQLPDSSLFLQLFGCFNLFFLYLFWSPQFSFSFLIYTFIKHLVCFKYICACVSRSVCACISWLSGIPWTVVHQAPLSMKFSRQEYWSGQPFPSLGDFPDPGIEPWSPALQVDFLLSESRGKPNLKANTNASLLVEKQTSLVTKFLCVKNWTHNWAQSVKMKKAFQALQRGNYKLYTCQKLCHMSLKTTVIFWRWFLLYFHFFILLTLQCFFFSSKRWYSQDSGIQFGEVCLMYLQHQNQSQWHFLLRQVSSELSVWIIYYLFVPDFFLQNPGCPRTSPTSINSSRKRMRLTVRLA